jgi:hypothetical protein
VALRTSGKTKSSTGKAIIHETHQAETHIDVSCGDTPMPLTVLINDTMQVMKTDSSSGMTNEPYRAGNLGMPKRMVGLLKAFIAIS